MKSHIQKKKLRALLILGCLLGTPASHAQFFSWTFDRPTCYWVAEGAWQNGPGPSTFNYHQLITQSADQFASGDVFVTLRLKSRPNVFWLYQGGGKWAKYDPNDTGKSPVAYYSAELQPLMKISITLPSKKKLPALNNGDWELHVGYGLRTSNSATIGDSFLDMISNSRDKIVWVAGAQNNVRTMCLTVSGVTINTPDVIPDPIGIQ